MRVLVIGCGSIGSRRARLLAEMGHVLWGSDADSIRLGGFPGNTAHTGTVIEAIDLVRPDAALICTPAESHVELARECLEAGVKGLFVEKPLSLSMDGVPELLQLAEETGAVTMGACNMRWAYPYIAANHAKFVSAAPLSSWRVGAEATYRDNGIVLESAIHELDVATAWFGPIQDLDVKGNGDRVEVRVQLERGRALICAEWSETAGTARYVAAPGLTDGYWHGAHADTSDQMYRSEMEHFLACVANGVPTCNPLSSAAHVLEWALRAQEGARQP